MRTKYVSRWKWLAGGLLFSSLAVAQVRISEIHYDNAGTDTGEAVEVSAPAGTDLTGWSVVLYNGNGGASYDTRALSGVVPAVCGERGVVVLNYGANGIQNGAPDGIALVNNGAVIEFLSYEGTFAATTDPAAGLTSVDIVAFQNGSGPLGETLQRDAAGSWTLAAGTLGACNDNGDTHPPAEVARVSLAPASSTLAIGSTVTLSATAFDAANEPIAGVTFSWSSTNGSAATVSANGAVTGIAAGLTTITATAANGVAGTASVEVIDLPPPS